MTAGHLLLTTLMALTKQRARNDADKEVRRRAIMRSARDVLSRGSYADLTVAAVAREAGLAKGTVYLYFRTKEELVLEVFEEEVAAWFSELDVRLSRAGTLTPTEFSDTAVTSLMQRPLLLQLASVVHSALEHNIELETAIRFKTALTEHIVGAGAHVERCLPWLTPGQGAQLFLRVHALVVGLQQLTHHSPIVAEAIEVAGLTEFDVDFAAELHDVLVTLLTGMENR